MYLSDFTQLFDCDILKNTKFVNILGSRVVMNDFVKWVRNCKFEPPSTNPSIHEPEQKIRSKSIKSNLDITLEDPSKII